MTWQQASVDPCRADTQLKRDLRYCSMMCYVHLCTICKNVYSVLFCIWHLLACCNASKHCAGWQVSKGFHAAIAKARMAERL